MTPKRIAILVILAIVMLVVAVATWGSVGSMAMVFCLILMGLSLLYQHFITCFMAICIIDLFKIIKVNQHHGYIKSQ